MTCSLHTNLTSCGRLAITAVVQFFSPWHEAKYQKVSILITTMVAQSSCLGQCQQPPRLGGRLTLVVRNVASRISTRKAAS